MNCWKTSTLEWFALRVRTNYEKAISQALEHKLIECFLPTYSESRIWSDRVKTIHRALFPGYLFCRIEPMDRISVLLTSGVINFVGFGTTPAAVPGSEIESLRTLVSSMAVKPYPYLQLGQKVCIETGPLAGVEGIIESFRNGQRIIVSITLLQRSVAAELRSDQVIPLPTNAIPRLAKHEMDLISGA